MGLERRKNKVPHHKFVLILLNFSLVVGFVGEVLKSFIRGPKTIKKTI